MAEKIDYKSCRLLHERDTRLCFPWMESWSELVEFLERAVSRDMHQKRLAAEFQRLPENLSYAIMEFIQALSGESDKECRRSLTKV